MKTKLAIISVAVSLITATQANATVWTTAETCTSPQSNSYKCVSNYGYKGVDPYGLDKYSITNNVDGTRHGCTSFAAYMLSINNPWIPGLSHFDAARSWAHDALTKTTGAVVDSDPSAGDIAQWGFPTDSDLGHVAYVEEVLVNTNGIAIGIVVADDNGGHRDVTTRKTIMKSSTSQYLSWPDNFITFPSFGSSGGSTSGGGSGAGGSKNGWLMTSIRLTP
jgi:surface antigen